MLSLVSVGKRFGKLSALSEVTLEFGRNETVGLIGPNGSGKTTLVNLATGMYGPDSGQILFRNADIANLEAHRIFRLGVARTFQNLRLFPRMTVLGNVEAGQYGTPGNGLIHLLLGDRQARGSIREKAEWALATVGLQDDRNRLADTLAPAETPGDSADSCVRSRTRLPGRTGRRNDARGIRGHGPFDRRLRGAEPDLHRHRAQD